MGRRNKNTFSKALGHLKSRSIDEKLQMLSERPTNSAVNYMTINPSTPNADFVSPEIGQQNAGREGQPDFSIGENPETQAESYDTSGLFLADGTIRTATPPGDNSYILGPMASMWYAWANKTYVGYIRQADRKMVNLGYITGRLNAWDGSSSALTSHGQLTLAQAQWFRTIGKKDGADNNTENYRAYYPGPPSNTPDEFGRYHCTITGEPKDPPAPGEGEPEVDPGESGEPTPEDNFAAWWARQKENMRKGVMDWLRRLKIGLPGTEKMPLDFEKRMKEAGYNYDDLFSYLNVNNVNVASAPNYDLYNWMLKTGLGMPAAEWKLNNPDKPDSSNPHLRPGTYIPKAVKPGKNNSGMMVTHYKPTGKVLSESRKSDIIKNLKNPVVLPEEQKKFKVKPKIRTLKTVISKPVATPEEYKPPMKMWGRYEYNQNVRASQERKNEVMNLLGEGEGVIRYRMENGMAKTQEEMDKFWGKNKDLYNFYFNNMNHKLLRKEQVNGDCVVFLVDEKGKKISMHQSELNEKLAEVDEKKLLDEYNKLNPKSEPISYENDPLFKKVSGKLNPVINYPKKPAVKGYPDKAPPKLVNGFHPDLGKNYKYDKLDPQSAETMPPQGDPEIDANIEKFTDKNAKIRKIKNLIGKKS